jgi:GNAT superfamily N-acetyltransferase
VSAARFGIEPLGGQHDRAAFSCGIEALDRYLQHQASQDVRRSVAAVFVLHDPETDAVAGYYTLSATSIEPTELPDDLRRRMPRYASLPAVLLGRLAVDRRYQGQRLGATLLFDALERALIQSSQIAAMAVVVDAKDDSAISFYERYGFQRFAFYPNRLYFPMQTIQAVLDDLSHS